MNAHSTAGYVRCIVFQEDGVWYGVALEYNIVESADTADVVYIQLQEAITGYREALSTSGDELIFVPHVDPEYEQMWQELLTNVPIVSPIQVKYYGVTAV
jgi:hypothetical protein